MKFPEVRFSKREKILLSMTVSTVVLYLLATFLVGPVLARWNDLSREIEYKELILTKGRRVIEREDMIVQKYEIVQDQLVSDRTTEEELSSFLSEIENLSGKKVLITNIKPLSTGRGEFSQSISLELDIEGEIGPLTKFLYGIYKSTTMIDVEQVDLGAKGWDGQVLKAHLIISRVLLRS